jgi:hypothetical protein
MSVIPSTGTTNIKQSINSTFNDGSLSGYVNDTLMNPIAGALVRVYFHGTYEENYTDFSGYYHVTNIPICNCSKNCTAFKSGFKPVWVLLSIFENTTHDFLLTPGNILFVGGNGTGNYSNIQDAINDSSDGDTVYVYDDSSPYYENVVVNKSITLMGEDRNNTIIDANGVGDVFYVSASNVTISGFTIQNSGNGTHNNAGIVIHSSYNIVNDNIISNNNECGIYCRMEYKYGNNIIYDNIIENNIRYGIIIEDTLNYENDVYGNHIENNAYGIGVTTMSEPDDITGKNNIFGNTITRNLGGIGIDSGYEILVYGNNITNNKCGIFMYGHWGTCFNNSVYQNNIINNDVGIRLMSGWCSAGPYNNNIYLNNIMCNKKGITIECGFEWGFTLLNNISQNNFINNNRNALFYCKWIKFYGKNIWNENYWNRPRKNFYPIFGKIGRRFGFGIIPIPWIYVDWHPAQEPYDIEV